MVIFPEAAYEADVVAHDINISTLKLSSAEAL